MIRGRKISGLLHGRIPGRLGLALMVWGVVAGSAGVRADSPVSKEYQLKAAFLLNFAQYMKWPAGAFGAADSPIVVGILGDDPFGAILEQTFRDEVSDGRKLVVKRSQRVEDLKGCQMLFIAASEQSRLDEIMKVLGDGSVVTVGETDQFVQRGGIIHFYVDNGRIRFEINAEAAEKRGVRINSQLLKRAKIVGAGGGKGGS